MKHGGSYGIRRVRPRPDYAGLADLNQDGYPDIVLGWALGGGEKGMDVYVWKDDGIELWRKTAYRGQMSLGEMDDEIQ